MPTRILKYPVELSRLQEINLPKGAGILSAAVDAGLLCVYAAIDPDAKECEPRIIEIIANGQDLPETPLMQRFVGTVTHHHVGSGSCYCWHVFERVAEFDSQESTGAGGVMTNSAIIEKLRVNEKN